MEQQKRTALMKQAAAAKKAGKTVCRVLLSFLM